MGRLTRKIPSDGYYTEMYVGSFDNKEFANKFIEQIHHFNDHCCHLPYYRHFIISLVNFERM